MGLAGVDHHLTRAHAVLHLRAHGVQQVVCRVVDAAQAEAHEALARGDAMRREHCARLLGLEVDDRAERAEAARRFALLWHSRDAHSSSSKYGRERLAHRRHHVAVLVAVDEARHAADVLLKPRQLCSRLGRRLRRLELAAAARVAIAHLSPQQCPALQPGARLVGLASLKQQRRYVLRPAERAALGEVEVQPHDAEQPVGARHFDGFHGGVTVGHHRCARDHAALEGLDDAAAALHGDAEIVGDDDAARLADVQVAAERAEQA
eukprot:scaffold90982_cov75-Phaeocystis_antarctica.AAC.2